MTWRFVAFGALATLAALGCQRTAPEDFPPPRDASGFSPAHSNEGGSASDVASSSVAPLAPGRCVRPTPAAAPSPVPPGPAAGCPADPERGPPKVPIVQLSFPDAAGVSVDAEVVRSEHDNERGLMYRRSMPPDHGMLFDLHTREDHRFWMHNTCIPLDLLYIDEDGLIVGIAENAPTMNDDSIGVGCPSRWVLEVNAGWSRKHGVKAGQRLALPSGI